MYQDFIDWAIKSIQAQTRKPDYLILMDDHSVDNTIAFVNAFFPNVFDKIIINEVNIGTVKTINRAVEVLAEAGCDYICGLSADDTFHPDYLLKTEIALKQSPKEVGFAYTWVRRIGDENQVDIHPEFDKNLLMQKPYIHGSALFKIECWKSVGGLPEGFPREEDWAMYRNMANYGWTGKLVPEPLLRWRKHNQFARTNFMDQSGELRRLNYLKKMEGTNAS